MPPSRRVVALVQCSDTRRLLNTGRFTVMSAVLLQLWPQERDIFKELFVATCLNSIYIFISSCRHLTRSPRPFDSVWLHVQWYFRCRCRCSPCANPAECLLTCPAATFLCSVGAVCVHGDRAVCLSDGALRRDRQMWGDRLPMPGLRHQPIQLMGSDRCTG